MQKQKKTKSYIAQIKVVSVVDVDIELPEATANFEAALTEAKGLTLENIYTQQDGVLTITNTGNDTARGITFTNEWMTFSANGFAFVTRSFKKLITRLVFFAIFGTSEYSA